MIRFIPFIGFSLLVVVLAMLLLNDHATQNDKPQALPALALNALDGKTVWHQSDLRDKITVINFFASWCTPCAAEMPELGQFKKKYPDVALHGVAWNDDPKTLAVWLKKNGNPFRTVWLDPNGNATMALGLKGVPETIVVDAKGEVRYRLTGPLTPQIRRETFDPLVEILQAEMETHAR